MIFGKQNDGFGAQTGFGVQTGGFGVQTGGGVHTTGGGVQTGFGVQDGGVKHPPNKPKSPKVPPSTLFISVVEISNWSKFFIFVDF